MSRAYPSLQVDEEPKQTSSWRTTVNLVRISKFRALLCAIAIVLITSSAFAAATSKTRQFVQGAKAKVSGSIVSRDGDLVRIRDKESGEAIVVSIGDTTQIE